jgi:hypothetical protein
MSSINLLCRISGGDLDTPNLAEERDSFPQRLKLAIGKRSARAFALQCGLSPTVMHQYLVGKSEPTRLALISMADASGVNLEWLISGEGPMEKMEGVTLIDQDLYDGIIEAVEEWLVKNRKALPVEKKLKTYHYLLEMFKGRRGVNKEQLENTLKLVA